MLILILALITGPVYSWAEPCAAMSEAMHAAQKKITHKQEQERYIHAIADHQGMPCCDKKHEKKKSHNHSTQDKCCGTTLCECVSPGIHKQIILDQQSTYFPIYKNIFKHTLMTMPAHLFAERLERPPRFS